MNVTIRIENSGRTTGTLGWLASRAAKITIDDMTGGDGRIACLRDADGKIITYLATADGDGVLGVYRASGDDDAYTPQIASQVRCWTDAAWKVVQELIEVAKGHLEEPQEMAALVSVKFEPAHADVAVRALAGIAHTDLAARSALVDRLQELEVA